MKEQLDEQSRKELVKYRIEREQTDEYKDHHLGLAYNITPFGWEIGKQKVRWLMQFGFNSSVNFQTGLTFRFGRY